MAKNLFKETLRKEGEMKEVDQVKKEILEREEANKDAEQFNIVNTVSDIQEGNIRVVKIKTLDCPEGFPIGAATSDEDAKAMIDNLRHYGSEFKFTHQVMQALQAMQRQQIIADQLVEADLIPDRVITVEGREFMVVNNKEARSIIDGTLVAELEVDNLPEKYVDELLTARIKESLETEDDEYDEDDCNFDDEDEEDEEYC
jgi:hypothetical protein